MYDHALGGRRAYETSSGALQSGPLRGRRGFRSLSRPRYSAEQALATGQEILRVGGSLNGTFFHHHGILSHRRESAVEEGRRNFNGSALSSEHVGTRVSFAGWKKGFQYLFLSSICC